MLKRTHFLAVDPSSPLPWGEGQGEGQTGWPSFAPLTLGVFALNPAQSKFANQKSKMGIDCTYAERKLNKTV
jgi:hypothetical protein